MIPAFGPGQAVRVLDLPSPGHVRTPRYLRGMAGRVLEVAGPYPDPAMLALGDLGLPYRMLYRVVFRSAELWPGYGGPAHDELVADLYEHWLEPEGETHV